MPIDLATLWDFDRPAESERRFRAALAELTDHESMDALVLRTQVARALGLQKQFANAHDELDRIDRVLNAGDAGLVPPSFAEARVRAVLERGRVWRSSGDPVAARPCFKQAFELAHQAGLEALAADALHMLPLVETLLDAQIAGARRLIDYARAAHDPRAKQWEGPGLNNLGVALNDAGRHDEALGVLREALVFRERAGRPGPIRVARWMVAHTLRRLGETIEALEIQRELEAEFRAAGEVDPYVFEELALLHAAAGNTAEAARYQELHRSTTAGP